jgi:hypothetical protein
MVHLSHQELASHVGGAIPRVGPILITSPNVLDAVLKETAKLADENLRDIRLKETAKFLEEMKRFLRDKPTKK